MKQPVLVVEETKQIKYLNSLIKQKLESLPRAIEGEAPRERLNKICEELRTLKEAKYLMSIWVKEEIE